MSCTPPASPSDVAPTTRPGEVVCGLAHRLGAGAIASADRVAVIGASVVTFGELDRAVRQAAQALTRSGVLPGQRFAVLSRNSPTMLELFFAASMSGTVVVPINHRLSPREVAVILDDSDARLLFVEDELRPLLAEVAEVPTTIRVADDAPTPEYLAWRDAEAPTAGTAHEPTDDSVVVQMYTTGTTGLPKGVMLTERNLRAMTDRVPEIFMVSPESRYLALLPMFHISGAGTPIAVLVAGGTIVMSTGTDATSVLRDLTTHRVTHANLVPSLMTMLLLRPGIHDADLGAMHVLMYGAAPSSGTTVEEMMALLPSCWFLHGYGLTECTGGVAYALPQRYADDGSRVGDAGAAGHHGGVGRPVPGCEVRIVDHRTLVDVAPGQAGEIWVRSEQNTPGYWNRPRETAALSAEAGWLRTGDIGLIDEHCDLHLKDRLKDMIISGGENVDSAEVEHVVASHPAVTEVAVYGVPDPRWGEAVEAAVTLRPGSSVAPEELIAFTRERLAHYKCPRSVRVESELPRTGNGKILKRALRDAAHRNV